MRLDVRSRPSLSIHRKYLFFDVLTDARLILFQENRIEFTFSVPGNVDFDLAEARFQRFAAVAIPAVIGVLVFTGNFTLTFILQLIYLVSQTLIVIFSTVVLSNLGRKQS